MMTWQMLLDSEMTTDVANEDVSNLELCHVSDEVAVWSLEANVSELMCL